MTDLAITPELERVVVAVEDEPASGLPQALRILRRCRRGFRCVRVFSATLVAFAAGRLERIPRALRILQAAEALADGCPCCAPGLLRARASVASWEGKHAEALRLAGRAVEVGRDPFSLMVRGSIRIEAVNAGATAPTGKAFADYREALRHLSPESRRYRQALFGVAASLAVEGRPEDRIAALAMLPELRRAFAGFLRVSVPVAQLDWLTGQIYGAVDRFEDGRRFLRRAVRKLTALEMFREAAGAWSDLVLLERRADAAGVNGRGRWRDRMLFVPRRARVRVPWPAGPFATVPGTGMSWKTAICDGYPVPVEDLRTAAGFGRSVLEC